MFINDVGGTFEEINVGRAGANYGWPVIDHGHPHGPGFVGPIHTYPQSSIGGADFCDPEFGWPAEYHHRFLFADFVLGWIKTINPDDYSDVQTFIQGIRRPTDLRFSPDGSLYVLLRNAWVMDGKFQPHTGTLMRVRYVGAQH
jgi:glucose/arabinose dehydrogenase